MEIYETLQEIAKDNRISFEELGRLTNTSRARIHNYLTGKTKIDISVFISICNALNVSPAQIIANFTNEDIEASDELLKHQEALDEVEEELYYSEKTINELESENIIEIFYACAKQYLQSIYYIDFKTEDIHSIIKEHPYEDEDKIGIQYYNEGIKLYEEIINYNIEPHVLSQVVSIVKFRNEEELSSNRTFRNGIYQLLEKLEQKEFDLASLFIVNFAKRDGNKFTKKFIEEHQEEISEYKQNVDALHRK